jgi:putative ABC transport system ATP-binding protein
MIELSALRFNYLEGDFSLSIPELHIASGEKVAVVGPSGSGKTTLLNLVAGIDVPQQGQINVCETALHDLNDATRRDFRITNIGFVFQSFELLDYLNVLDNILHSYRISRALKLNAEVRERAKDLAGQMGLGHMLDRRSDALSQGERQRAAICRALLPKPQLILADEATGNLDPENKRLILDLLFNAVDHQGATLLAVTHDHDLLPSFDRVIDFHQYHEGSADDTGAVA